MDTEAKKGLDVDQTYTVKEFEQKFKLGHTKTYEEIDSGRLATYRVGRRRYVSAHAAADWQRRLEAESNPVQEQAAAVA